MDTPPSPLVPLEENMTNANRTHDVVREGANAVPPWPLDLDPTSTPMLRLLQEMLETTLKRVLAEVAVRPAPSSGQGLTESGPSSPKKTSIDLNPAEKVTAADLRVALLIGKIPDTSGLLIDTKTLAKLLAISRATFIASKRKGRFWPQSRWVMLSDGVWRKFSSGSKPVARRRACGRTGKPIAPENEENDMRPIDYTHIIKPSVDVLELCGSLMIDTRGMAEFLGIPVKQMGQLHCTDRLPLPCRLGLGKCLRWSVLELLGWVEVGCPRCGEWVEMRRSGRWWW
jgi:hypothetical protein